MTNLGIAFLIFLTVSTPLLVIGALWWLHREDKRRRERDNA